MRQRRAWRGRRLASVLAVVILAGCGGDDGTSPSTKELIGTWVLESVSDANEERSAPPGTLTWTISTSTITAISDDGGCIEVGTYSVSGNRLIFTTTSVTGPECGDEPGESFSLTFEVSGDTLTVVASDPELGTATFVFRRA